MMSPGWLALLVAGVVLIVVFELVAVARKRLTISQLVWRESRKRPYLAFGFGVLMGHWFALGPCSP